MLPTRLLSCFFFFNDTATTEIYTLSLHDALPILEPTRKGRAAVGFAGEQLGEGPFAGHGAVEAFDLAVGLRPVGPGPDRKSTRLNSSHANISYAVFCLKKKKRD